MNNGFLAADYRRIARDKLRGNWPGAVLAVLIVALLGGLDASMSISFSVGDWPWPEYLRLAGDWPWWEYFMQMGFLAPRTSIVTLISLAQLVVGGAVVLGWCSFNQKLVWESEASVQELFGRFSILLKALGLRIFMALFIFFWSLLLVVPGIIAAYRYALAPYLMAENPNMGVREAVDISKRTMAGRKGKLFCLHVSFIGWWFLSILTLGIGFLFLTPYAKAAETAFYFAATGRPIPLRA